MTLLVAVLLAACGALAEVPIGYYGPADPAHPAGGSYWQGATLAIEEANREGGYKGSPFRLVQGWDENPWSGGAATVVRMVYQARVWAIIGGIDGASTHLAEQVVAKALVPLVDPASTDRTVNAAFVPWMFSLMPDDRALMAILVDELIASPHRDSFVMLSATDHDSRVMATEFLSVLSRSKARARRRIDFEAGSHRIAEFAAQVSGTGAKAVVVLAGAADTAAVVRELHRAGPAMPIYGGPATGSRTFLKLAGGAARGVRYPSPLGTLEWADTFRTRWGEEPDYAAYHAYDAVRMVVSAICKAGLDRAAIRDALRELSPWSGVSGVVEWDKLGRNTRGGRMAIR
jgi:branched-chain amino acid transport system substrate-binding protein